MAKSFLDGDEKYYFHLSVLLTIAFILIGLALVLLNLQFVQAELVRHLGKNKAYFPQLFFWGCAGATIASSIFMANDKERNEIERLKDKVDASELRYPNTIDVFLYAQRIISSGFLALLGAVLLLAGLSYFDLSINTATTKHHLFFIIVCFMIGLYENRFLDSLQRFSIRVFKD